MNIGQETLPASLRMTIHRGGVGQRPNRLSATLPVKSGDTILSGMVMTQYKNVSAGTIEWTIGYTAPTGADLNTANFYFAVDNSTDGDVLAAGNLQGLSARGDYELSTSQFKANESFSAGDYLTPDGVTGKLMKATTAGQPVVGVVTKDYLSPVNLGATYSYESGTDAYVAGSNVTDGVLGTTYTRPLETAAQSLQVLRFETVQPFALPAADADSGY